ncbi:hypothetical protein ACF0H5_004157 [Mactra antiquata]
MFEYIGVNLTTVLIIVIVSLVVRLLLDRKRYSPPLPPSPSYRLPIIGHLHLLDIDVRKHLRKFRRQLGDVYSLWYGEKLVIHIAGYENIREAFLKNADKFAARPHLYISEKCNKKTGIIWTENELWREQRTFAFSTMKRFGMGKSVLEIKIKDEAKSLIEEMKKEIGTPFDPRTLLSTCSTNVVVSIVFKGRFQHTDKRLIQMLDTFNSYIVTAAGIGNFIPWLAKLPGDLFQVKKLFRNWELVIKYAKEIIAEHEKDFDEDNIEDLTSAYISEMRRLKASGVATTMNYDQLTGTICDLFMAGTSTTASALRWSIVCLVQFPDIQEKLYNEVSNAIGTELPSMKDKARLVYLEAFAMEVMRYCEMILVAMHATSHDLVYKGFSFPKEAMIIPDFDSVLYDENIWGDPEVFRPERFIDDHGNLIKRDEMIIFFIGKRSCMGEALAKMEMLIFLGAIVQNFKFESPPGETLTVEKVDGQFGFTHGPNIYNVVMTSR